MPCHICDLNEGLKMWNNVTWLRGAQTHPFLRSVFRAATMGPSPPALCTISLQALSEQNPSREQGNTKSPGQPGPPPVTPGTWTKTFIRCAGSHSNPPS